MGIVSAASAHSVPKCLSAASRTDSTFSSNRPPVTLFAAPATLSSASSVLFSSWKTPLTLSKKPSPSAILSSPFMKCACWLAHVPCSRSEGPPLGATDTNVNIRLLNLHVEITLKYSECSLLQISEATKRSSLPRLHIPIMSEQNTTPTMTYSLRQKRNQILQFPVLGSIRFRFTFQYV